MISFTAVIKRFDAKGEKTGWTYIEVPEHIAMQIKPGNKKGFRIKGTIDSFRFEGFNLLPMGGGNFILPLNTPTRKAIGKKKGAIVSLSFEEDKNAYLLNADLIECMQDDPAAKAAFDLLPRSHQNYYSKWVDSAKTEDTKARRISMVIRGLAEGLDYAGILRKAREEKSQLQSRL